jgi:hypothetical protein
MDVESYISYKGLSSGGFSDTADRAALAANALGIISGMGDGRFDPNGA